MSPLFCSMLFLGSGVPAFPATAYALIVRNGAGPYLATIKYSFAAGAIAAGGDLSVDYYSGGACGNLTYGIIGGCATTGYNTVNKYTYATYTVAGGGNFTVSQVSYVSACGNSTRGIWSSYYNQSTSTSVSTAQKYSWAGSTFATGGSFSVIQLRSGAISDATYGVFIGGYNSAFTYVATSQRYTFSSDTSAASTSLANERIECPGGSNTTYGIVGSGRRNGPTESIWTHKWTWATSVITAGTNLAAGGPGTAAAGDSSACWWFGGYGQATTDRAEKYTYASNVVANGTSLSSLGGTVDGCATSSTPGGW